MTQNGYVDNGHRYALIIGGPKPLVQGSFTLDGRSLQPTLLSLASKLSALGSMCSFRWHEKETGLILNSPSVADVHHAFRSLPRPGEQDIILIYYVGHSKPFGENDLVLSFDDIDDFDATQQHTLSRLLEIASEKRFKRFLLILDCCHALFPVERVGRIPGEYAVMFSTTRAYASAKKDGGLFTKQLVSSLSFNPHDPADQRIDVGRSAITVRTLFSHISANLQRTVEFAQEPRFEERGLGDLELAPFRKTLPLSLQTAHRIDSIYRKLFRILSVIDEGGAGTTLVITKCQEHDEFRFQSVDSDDDVVSEERIKQHIDFLKEIGFISIRRGIFVLTVAGVVAASPKTYSKALREGLERSMPSGINFSVIREIIVRLLARSIVPNSNAIATEAYSQYHILIPDRKKFRDILKLLPYTGVFEKATTDTLFPGLRSFEDLQEESELSME